jgi:hypothetical protein
MLGAFIFCYRIVIREEPRGDKVETWQCIDQSEDTEKFGFW